MQPNANVSGGHAFAIVGYNSDGFIVQNSWGKGWGSDGFALWLYEDWISSISDGWVFRLAIPTPQVFGITARSLAKTDAESDKAAPKRMEIAGHFVHFDDGAFKQRGDYWSTLSDIQNTARLIKESVSDKRYRHLLIYAHGGLNTSRASATRISALKEGFKRNGIYPFHVMYDTGLVEELKDTVIRAYRGDRMEGFLGDLKEKLIDLSDKLIEDVVRKPVTPIWEEMKRDARLPFVVDKAPERDGSAVIRTFAEALHGTGIQIHLAGHSTGAVLLGHLLDSLNALGSPDLIQSCSLMAPACSVDFFNEHYVNRMAKPNENPSILRLPVLDIYNMTEKLERDDNVGGVYRKSLLYLVSRALERNPDKPILGMQKYSEKISSIKGLNIHYSDGRKGKITRSTSHGGFDNDHWTMNSILRRILGNAPPHPFLEREMKGY
ncbi:hypothetical protein [Desulfobacter postgatei]|uniref:hypothetical protein n=1 Tax=Desulfobacter postgatei TaxID=2293 RepID=UPI003531A484